ncbi:uncharacterized protein LOC134204575 [Armigeres subalbatus]|uniref:uncharacterized protein LOC134204575 n=1 Tax=Armigeres subalbatus TaxID=124917 RepID=UPI002ED13E6E
MEVKRVRVTNRKQFEFLVNRLETQPAVAKGLKFCEASGVHQVVYTEFWNELAVGLNSLGPPTRTVKDWQKVWTDYKLKVKNKLAHNKREVTATGGGPNTIKVLSPTEEAVANLLLLDKMINHSGFVFGLPNNTSSPPNPVQAPSQPGRNISPPGSPLLSSTMVQQCMTIDGDGPIEGQGNLVTEINNRGSKPSARKRKNMDDPDIRQKLLIEQTELMNKIVENTGECARYARKTFKLREEESKNRRRYLLQKEKDRKDMIQVQMEMLNYKKKKLEIMERQERKQKYNKV